MSKIIGGEPHGRRDAIVDATTAVLLEHVDVVAIEGRQAFRTTPMIGLELEGRLNKSDERSDVLYLFDEDGAAAIISELMGVAARGDFLDRLLERIHRLP